ncbi:serine threonine kinase irei [Colletotrichum truncatum]|uniref:Serine threonine kinase irei n=1 Tax=Colletotrichum truncatum TaxID=5467 RepID=A0ACC3Z2K4_COLTU|nr:serine threonine kinase irei [Colletotrichum truncatum]XP_036576035.1 serine threonine kinase irei [Colletotrichum truncatum]KAF6780595.1 serine threonine kinase irei [Colletotrichum truncatum]KAF6782706.1 serine threonine kinase irei [Colletotrichum truncatum]
MLRRPPGEGRRGATQRTYLLALAVLVISCIPLADAQQPIDSIPRVQRVQQPVAGSSQHEGIHDIHAEAARNWAATLEADNAVESPRRRSTVTSSKPLNRRNDPDNILIPNDASAVATLAPAQSVRAPSPSGHRPIVSRVGGASGISTQHHARSLKDWEVEDFVLLATVDGHLYASDRATARERWHLEVDQSMVETKHFRLNASDLDDDYNFIDHYVWAIEPNRDGDIYYWVPGASEPRLLSTGLTMKQMVDEGASALENPPIVYTGTKKTTMITLDAATGRVLRWFGSGGSHVNEAESCLRPNALYDQNNEECSSTGTITLGRTEYEVGIARKDGRPIASLKYFDWTPNTNDWDLLNQYHQSIDNRYHTTRHDGRVYGLDYGRENFDSERPEEGLFCSEKFPSPVVKVFDVCRPWGVLPESNPDLIVLPQPVPPAKDESIARVRSQRIFVNQTETGNWYALSGRSYPLMVLAPTAKTSEPDWLQLGHPWEKMNETQRIRAMVGTHNMDAVHKGKIYQTPSLPGRAEVQDDVVVDPENDSALPLPNAVPEEPVETTIVNKVKAIPQQVSNSFIDFFSNPVLFLLVGSLLFLYHKDLRRWYKTKTTKWYMRYEAASDSEDNGADVTPEHTVHDQIPSSASARDAAPPNAVPKIEEPAPDSKPEAAEAAAPGSATPEAAIATDKDEGQPDVVPQSAAANSQASLTPPEPGTPEVKKKKPAHRGRRGGTKHRKGKKREEVSQSREDEAPASVEDAVNKAKKLGGQVTQLEPDVVTVTNDMQAVSGPIIRMGNIEVDTDNQLGTGSNGTLVFAGKFDGREVAVKRMLIQFYDIASQETRLLRESDDHPNVIRYYAQQVRDGFLYIALERCAASLADVVEKPHHFSKLAQAGKADIPGVLYQITNGINHLHQLRIVHRDLKPQNILVNVDKHGKPRLLVSDFGLCKKLEGGQSSFGATTGRAAGTSGWRAPELLLDDDARDTAMVDSINSGSGSILVGSDMVSGRRATRSIDIFSLGLVFFYVLTNGLHPFDCGDRYMREVNIRKGNFNLSPLDSLGDAAPEAKHLITQMLSPDPKERPTAREVLAHPFFWPAKKRLAFLCDVSDSFEKEPRDPPSGPLSHLETYAPDITKGDFLRQLPREFVDSLGKQRKYTGTKMLDLLRALRNKKNHYEDMPDTLKRAVGPLPEGYLSFWAVRFPRLLIDCWEVIWAVRWDTLDRFKEYYEPQGF